MVRFKERRLSFFRGSSDNEQNGNIITHKKERIRIASPFSNKSDKSNNADKTQQPSYLTRKRIIENEIREILSEKEEAQHRVQSQMSKLQKANGKKLAYILQLNTEIVSLQSNAIKIRAQTRRSSFGSSFGNANGQESDLVRARKENKEKFNLMKKLVSQRNETKNLCKILVSTISVRDSAVTDLQNIGKKRTANTIASH